MQNKKWALMEKSEPQTIVEYWPESIRFNWGISMKCGCSNSLYEPELR